MGVDFIHSVRIKMKEKCNKRLCYNVTRLGETRSIFNLTLDTFLISNTKSTTLDENKHPESNQNYWK